MTTNFRPILTICCNIFDMIWNVIMWFTLSDSLAYEICFEICFVSATSSFTLGYLRLWANSCLSQQKPPDNLRDISLTKAIFRKYLSELFIRTLSTTLLQIFWKFMLHSEIIVKTWTGPDIMVKYISRHKWLNFTTFSTGICTNGQVSHNSLNWGDSAFYL